MLLRLALLGLLSSCAVDVEVGRDCPRGNPACTPAAQAAPVFTDAPPAAPAPVPAPVPPALTPAPVPIEAVQDAAEPLRVEIQRAGLPTSEVVLSCDERCVEVTAHASGGRPPYGFKWDDGSEDATRLFCPAQTNAYGVLAFDASDALEAPEASEASMQAIAAVTIQAPDCPVPPVDAPDAPTAPPTAEPAARMCERLSGEAVPRGLLGCPTSDRIVFYFPLRAGAFYDLFAAGPGLFLSLLPARWRLQFWGSPDGCELVEDLGGFQVTQAPVIERIQFVPKQDHALLVLDAQTIRDNWPPPLGVLLCE